MTPLENRALDTLEGKWKAKARKMPGNGLRWLFTRPKAHDGDVIESGKDREDGVAMAEVMESDKPWSKLAHDGIMVRPEAWKEARALNSLSGLPLMVIMVAADGIRFLKVSDFGPAYAETKRLAVPDFRPV